ncbi:MAG: PH domain-containing protein [Methylococcales bacterium]|nr:MAG: PH domain-containing protein [Methylococcales bacterium]
MSYINKNLLDGEVVLHQSKLTKYNYVSSIFQAAIGGLFLKYKHYIPNTKIPDFDFMMSCIGWVLIGSAIFVGLNIFVEIFSTEIYVTNKRVIFKTGLIRRNINEMTLLKIENVKLHQDITGRIFDIGSLSIEGTGGGHILIEDIDAPMALHHNILQAIENRLVT